MKRGVIIILFSIFAFVEGMSQDVTLQERIIAEHIYNFGVYTGWKKNKRLQEFQTDKFIIGVCSQDSAMFELLQKICKYRIIKWKKIEVLYFPDTGHIKYTHILYVGREMNNYVPGIDKKISDWSTLMITDSCNNYNKTMINFFPKNSLKKVEINKQEIESRGMKVNPLLFTVAKKYEEDWEQMYQESIDSLAIERELVSQQQLTLEAQSKEIKIKEKLVKNLSDDISAKEKTLNEQTELLFSSQRALKEKIEQITAKTRILNEKTSVIKGQETEIVLKKEQLLLQAKEYEKQKQVLAQQKNEIGNQRTLLTEQKLKLSKSLEDIKKQQLVLYFLIIVIILIGLLAFNIYRGYRMKKKINSALKKKNVEIFQQKEEIAAQRDEIEAQRDEITSQRDLVVNQKSQIEYILSELTDSIHYSKRIQSAILPSANKLKLFPFEHFVLYKPKDIISGDFYWYEQIGKKLIICVGDCTGHGVPGALMSMLSIAALNDAVKSHSITAPSEILNYIRSYVISALQQDNTSSGNQISVKDGMDIALCMINTDTLEMQFSGANNPLYIVKNTDVSLPIAIERPMAIAQTENRSEPANSQLPAVNDLQQTANSKLLELKGDKMPIGIHDRMDNFNQQDLVLQKGDCMYLMSDGYADQFGGPKGKKIKYKPLKEILIADSQKQMSKQKEKIETFLKTWQGEHEQVDDITIFGIKI